MTEELSDQIDDILAGADSSDLASIVSAIEGRMEMSKHYLQEAIADTSSDLDLRRDLQDCEQLEDLFAKAVSILRAKAKRDKPAVKPQDVFSKLFEAVKLTEYVDDCDPIEIHELINAEQNLADLVGFARGYREQFYKELQYKNDRRAI